MGGKRENRFLVARKTLLNLSEALQPPPKQGLEGKKKKKGKEKVFYTRGVSAGAFDDSRQPDIEFHVARDPLIIPWKRKTCPSTASPLFATLATHPLLSSLLLYPSHPERFLVLRRQRSLGFKAFQWPPLLYTPFSTTLFAPRNPRSTLLCVPGRFLINPSTPLINDRCPFPFYDQRFRSPLIDADHHRFTPFHPVAKRGPGF